MLSNIYAHSQTNHSKHDISGYPLCIHQPWHMSKEQLPSKKGRKKDNMKERSKQTDN